MKKIFLNQLFLEKAQKEIIMKELILKISKINAGNWKKELIKLKLILLNFFKRWNAKIKI